jgi:ATP phosphoribosyltransferase regulatory subunit
LADLRGYHYHTGATFSVFATDDGGAVIDCGRGGRYDGVGRAFGRARPATGFTLDLRRLSTLVNALVDDGAAADAISAPDDPDPALAREVALLRSQGEAVVVALPGEGTAATRRSLTRIDNEWRVVTR